MEKNGLKTGCRQGLVSLTALACLATVPGLAMAEEDGFFSKVLNNATYKAEGVLSAYRYAPPDPDDKGIEDDRLEAWTHFSIQSDTSSMITGPSGWGWKPLHQAIMAGSRACLPSRAKATAGAVSGFQPS